MQTFRKKIQFELPGEKIDMSMLNGPFFKDLHNPYKKNIQNNTDLQEHHHCTDCCRSGGSGARTMDCLRKYNHLRFCAEWITIILTIKETHWIWIRNANPKDCLRILKYEYVSDKEWKVWVRTRCGQEFRIMSSGCHKHPYSTHYGNMAYKLHAEGYPVQMSMFDDPEQHADVPLTPTEIHAAMAAEDDKRIQEEFEKHGMVINAAPTTFMNHDLNKSRIRDATVAEMKRARKTQPKSMTADRHAARGTIGYGKRTKTAVEDRMRASPLLANWQPDLEAANRVDSAQPSPEKKPIGIPALDAKAQGNTPKKGGGRGWLGNKAKTSKTTGKERAAARQQPQQGQQNQQD